MKNLRVEIKDGVAFITLCRGEKGNSYDYQMASDLQEAFENVSNTPLKAVVLSAEGKNFCTGADLDWMEKKQNDMVVIRDMYLSILKCPHPIVGKVFGKVRGGGLGMTAACDVVIAAEQTDFALTEVKHGLIPGMITPILLSKISRADFDDWASSGRTVTVEEARTAGLVNFIGDIPEDIFGKIQRHPFRKDLTYISNEIDRYLKLSSEHRQKMIRASEKS